MNPSNYNRPLGGEEAALIKKMLWEGGHQSTIADTLSVSQSRVSRISTGRLEADASWPNGDQGGFPDKRKALILGQKRRNSRRVAVGLQPIPLDI